MAYQGCRRQQSSRTGALLTTLLLGLSMLSCDEAPSPQVDSDVIRIGAVLPFSGPRASTGIHLERALMMAVADVNRAGGVDGRMLHLVVKDSNSGSERGVETVKDMLHDGVSYLIGPEEDNVALAAVREVKEHDVFHILPSFTSPSITDSGRRGAWLQLAPSALTMGCALATKAIQDGIATTRTLAAGDDYHLELASVFSSALSSLGGRAFPTVSVAAGRSSYSREIERVSRYDADATLLFAYPGTAATVIREMSRADDIRWYFSPMARDDALLWNVPKGVLEGAVGVSPSLTSNSECEDVSGQGGQGGEGLLDCDGDAAERFARAYQERFQVDASLKAAHYYYDAVILLALQLQRAAVDGLTDPRPQELLSYFTRQSEDPERIAWDSLDEGLDMARAGEPIFYVGAGGEYQFNRRGQNVRAIVDTWVVDDKHRFRDRESVVCSLDLNIY